MQRTYKSLSLFAALSTAGLLAACGGGGSDTTTTSSGTLGVSLTDAPSCGYDAVNVTVNKVRVNKSASASDTDAGWTDITLNPARKINLLNLTNGALEDLGQTPLEPGHYTQLRLVLDANTGNGLANSVLLTGSANEVPLETPSAVQSGIKLGHEFDVASGQRVDLVLDFDACKSIVKRGNGKFGLKPVITVIPTVLNGISGFVSAPAGVQVSAQQNGVIVRSTVPNATTGEFYLARVPAGNYDVVVTSDNRAASVIGTVPVATATTTVAVSTAAAPIVLAAAATAPRTISGSVTLPATFSDVAFVTAQQTFTGGPKVTLKYQNVTPVVGSASAAYSMGFIPTVAPQFAAYSATLPLVFAAKSDVTPGVAKYAVEASATGLTSKVVTPVDISVADQANVNFTFP